MAERKTPLAVFAYNRPQHLDRALRSIANCVRLDECQLYIFCDGTKSDQQVAAVQMAQQVAREWAVTLHGQLVVREENLGLARSIETGVTDLCVQSGRLIVVEDDLVVHPRFVDYMLTALDRYEDADQVFQISGFMFPVKAPPGTDTFFLPLTTTWGWATWERAWRVFDPNVLGAQEQLSDPMIRRQFNLDDSYPFAEMLQSRLEGKIDSWAIAFWWAVFRARGVVLYPRRSLVWQGGGDASGTHGDVGSVLFPEWHAVMDTQWHDSWRLPENIHADEMAFNSVQELLRSRYKWTTRLARRIRSEFDRPQREYAHRTQK